MKSQTTFEALATAFAAEDVDTVFTLMGDANMHWATAMAGLGSARLVHACHENAAVAMATGYARATGRVGVASVTCGPGFAQVTTALTTAARGNVPMVVFAGDTALGEAWSIQQVDQAALTAATGACFMPARSPERMFGAVRDAFYIARYEKRPVVLSVPFDLQMKAFPADVEYTPSATVMPKPARLPPAPEAVEEAAGMIAAAERPILVAGRGVLFSNATDDVAELARRGGALLANTLYARGMFDADPYSIGIAGGFATDLAWDLFHEADLVVGIGASFSHHTTLGGKLFPDARVIQIDPHPRGVWQGQRVADLHVQADAREACLALGRALQERGLARPGFRTAATAERIAEGMYDGAEFDLEPGTVDPRRIVEEIDAAIPKDWYVVGGSGHCAYFTSSHMRGRSPELFQMTRDFGAIGGGLSHAIGVAAARGDGKVVLIDGDGGLLMYAGELETIRRHGLQLLIVALNDGAFGSELYKLKAQGRDYSQTIFGRPDFAGVAKGFGLRGATVTEPGGCAALFEAHAGAGQAEVWDVHISRNVNSPLFRRIHGSVR